MPRTGIRQSGIQPLSSALVSPRPIPSGTERQDWLALDLPNCESLFVADWVHGLARSGGMAIWRDNSVKNYTPSQATASQQPLWGVNAVNGRPSVQFDDASVRQLGYSGSGLGIVTEKAGFTVVAVVRDTWAFNDSYYFGAMTGIGNQRMNLGWNWQGAFYPAGRRDDGDPFVTPVSWPTELPFNTWLVATFVLDFPNALVKGRLNGREVWSTTWSTAGATIGPTTSSAVYLGNAGPGVGGAAFTGDIAALAIFPRVVSPVQLILIERALGRLRAINVA